MKGILVLALFAALVPAHAAPQIDRVSFNGILVRSDTGEPIANARVKIGKTDIPPQYDFPFSNILMSFWRPGTEMSTGTDDQGRFDFSGLVTGDYIVAAEADGYTNLMALPGERSRYSDFAKRMTIRTSEPPEAVKLSLFRLSRIGGVVHGPAGQTVAGVNVHLVSIEYSEGRRGLNGVENTETDDNGEYQFPARSAGEYYVEVVADPYNGSEFTTRGRNGPFMATFFPNALNLTAARAITLGGSDVRADVNLPPIPSNWKTISGKVLDGIRIRSTPPNGAPVIPEVVNLVWQGDGSIDWTLLPNRVVGIGASGEFQIKDVAPGIYDLYASSSQWTHTFSGHVSVEVKDKDISGLNIVFDSRSADVITGTILDDSGRAYPVNTPILNPRTVTPWLVDVRSEYPARDPFTFRFVNVPAGVYDLNIRIPSDTYLADIRQGEKSILDSGLVVGGSTPGPIEVLIRKGGGTVRIQIQGDRNRPGLVVLVPDAPGRANRSRYHAINSTSANLTTFENVTPGNYKAFVVERWLYDPFQTAYLNADFLAKYEDLGVSVTVQDGQTADVRVNMSFR